ncbi:MAG: ABC transporter ATP-binding protein, partial [Candidatus Dormibacteraeota bacterium]|nr:ABC transporter ATP-binding protein [Candidatus Dormibacteraeota bacterium]
MADVLFADDVSRWFEVGGRNLMAVREANFQIAEAELVVVLGRSGSGKSTLLSLCGGLDTPDVGRVLVKGRDVASLRGGSREAFLQRTVGWVAQNAGLLPLLTAGENVALVAQIAGEPEEEASRLAGLALQATGLSERAEHREDELSGGERQRVALCVALAHRPALLLADEPTGELDADSAHEVRVVIAELARAHGATVIVVSHDPATAEMADRSLRIRDG